MAVRECATGGLSSRCADPARNTRSFYFSRVSQLKEAACYVSNVDQRILESLLPPTSNITPIEEHSVSRTADWAVVHFTHISVQAGTAEGSAGASDLAGHAAMR